MSTQKARPPQPNLPTPAHYDVDSMLSRKFGKEIANYFSGSPLNRVSFLRSDHSFISSAFTHPSTSFLLFKDLSPMAKDPSHLAYASHNEIKSLTGDNPFGKTEEEIIKEFNSSVTLPLVLFLGLDEKKRDGFEYGRYKGSPYFAIDITPKGSIKGKAEGIIEAMKAKGMIFLEGRTAMAMNAPEGRRIFSTRRLKRANRFCKSCHICPSPSSPRLECPKPLLRRLRPTHSLNKCRHETGLPTNRLRPITYSSRRRRTRDTHQARPMPNKAKRIKSLIPPNRPHR